jgi:two-component system LytT family response regulator
MMENMLNAVIVDDEDSGVESLRLLLNKYCTNVNVVAVANSVSEAEEKIPPLSPDIVFLDIAMPFANGFELLKRIKNKNFSVIFTTAYNEYALKAIKHSALDYLLKPIDPEELVLAIKKCEEHKSSKAPSLEKIENLVNALAQSSQKVQKLPVPTLDEIMYVDIDTVIRLEADSNYTNIFLSDKQKLTSSKTLKEFESLLSGQKFFRIHKTHIVNLDFIKKYIKGDGGYVVMADGKTLEVSRLKKTELLLQMSL